MFTLLSLSSLCNVVDVFGKDLYLKLMMFFTALSLSESNE